MKDEAFVEEDITTSLYDHARLIVTNRKAVVNGNANQIFWLDEETKLLHAFATDDVNIGMIFYYSNQLLVNFLLMSSVADISTNPKSDTTFYVT